MSHLYSWRSEVPNLRNLVLVDVPPPYCVSGDWDPQYAKCVDRSSTPTNLPSRVNLTILYLSMLLYPDSGPRSTNETVMPMLRSSRIEFASTFS